MSLRVLIVSHLWPRADFPHLGIFVADQVAELANHCYISVVAPVDLTHYGEELALRELTSLMPKYRARSQPEFLPFGGLIPRVIPFRGRFLRKTFAVSTARNLCRALDHNKLDQYDLVHAHTLFPDGLACAFWLENKSIPLVITAHGSDVHSIPSGVRKALPAILKRADRLIAVSRSLADKLIALGADPARISVLPNGFSADLFDRIPDIVRERRKIVFLGRLGAIKRVDLLIRALAHCPPDAVLEIAGDGAARSHLESLTRELNLHQRVKFLGMISREEVPRFLAGAALMCIVSEKEGWPTVIFEALACGTPVLATAVGGIPEALAKPELGNLVPADISPPELADQIESALMKEWDHAAIHQYALQYSWEAISSRIYQIYQQECVDLIAAGTMSTRDV